ncbi:MAG: hypothetical protein ABJK39_05510 [Hyphomicrobiales bacterium]
MLHSFRSFFLLSLIVGAIGLFLVTMVQVVSEPKPAFSKIPSPTGFILQTTT